MIAYNIHRSIKQPLQKIFQSTQQDYLGRHVDKKIHITVGAVIATCKRSEKAQPAYTKFFLEIREMLIKQCKAFF